MAKRNNIDYEAGAGVLRKSKSSFLIDRSLQTIVRLRFVQSQTGCISWEVSHRGLHASSCEQLLMWFIIPAELQFFVRITLKVVPWWIQEPASHCQLHCLHVFFVEADARGLFGRTWIGTRYWSQSVAADRIQWAHCIYSWFILLEGINL